MIKNLLSIGLFLTAGLFFHLRAQEPDGYYVKAEGAKKEQLKTSLSGIVNAGATTISYSGLWTAYKKTDVREDGKLFDIYSVCNFTMGTAQCGNYVKVCDCYNREHTVPQSWFNKATPMVSDIIHVLPTDGKVNGQRSNFPYGECANGTKEDLNARGRLGECTYPSSYKGIVFEPDDEFKGDIARIYFYMATRYENKISNWTTDGSTFGNGTYPGLQQWQLDVLLKWHRQDPVSPREIKRNNAVYSVQKNRNPFVDHPELAEHIWGTKMNEAWNLASSLEKTPALKVYSNAMTIHINGITSPITYRVYNISGSLVAQGVNDSDCSIQINRSGIYIISIQTDDKVINKKISL